MPPNKAWEAHTYTTSKKPRKHTYICNLEEAQGVLTYKSAAMNGSGHRQQKVLARRISAKIYSLRGLFVDYAPIHFIRALYVCPSWAIHRLHIFMCSWASHLFDLLRKHEAETDEQQDTGSPDHRHAIMNGEISTNSGTNSKEEDHTKIMSHLLQLLLFMIPHESG